MSYQIVKAIGSSTAATFFIASVTAMAGVFEMEVLAAGAIRVMSGLEKENVHSRIPVWQGYGNEGIRLW